MFELKYPFAEVFGIDSLGAVKEGNRADLILLEGRPDITITDIQKIKQIWIDGKVYGSAERCPG